MSKDSQKPKLALVPNAVPFSEAGKYSCDIMRAFIQHRFDYISNITDPWLSLHFCPEIAIINIERFKVSTKDLLEEQVGFNPAIAFCIDHSLQEYFSSHPGFQAAIEIREKCYGQQSHVPGKIMEVIHSFQNNFGVSFNHGPRKNIRTKKEIIDNLSLLASALGMHNYELANLCIFHTLSQARSTIEDHALSMENTVKEAMAQLEIRNRIITAMLKEFGKELGIKKP